MSMIMPGAEPFFFEGNRIGVLLLHGFTGAPNEMRGLGGYLAERGLTVSGILIAGHGTTPEEMTRTTWRDWWGSARQGLRELQARCDKVFVMGLSMGGALTLHLAAHYTVAGIVLMGAPIFLHEWRLRLINTPLRRVLPYVKKGKGDIEDPTLRDQHVEYPVYPTACFASLLEFLAHLRGDLGEIEAPTLLIHARGDKGVPPENMPYIYGCIGSQDKAMMWVERGGHIVTEDWDRELVFERAWGFVRERM
jgi:carboxylesterase